MGRHIRVSMLILLGFLSCDGGGAVVNPYPDRCNQANCAGCCNDKGSCMAGTTDTVCGQFGAVCRKCSFGAWCTRGYCSSDTQFHGFNTGGTGGNGP